MSLPLILAFSAVFGLLIGSFLNCLSWRLHEQSTMLGRSQCDSCRALIAWFDNIPVLSYFLLRGRCRHCNAKISWQHPVVEAVTGLLFAAAVWRIIGIAGSLEGWDLRAVLLLLRDLVLVSALVVTFLTDLRWYEIYDIVVLPAAVVAGLLNLAAGAGWLGLLISGTIGSGFFLLQSIVSRGRWIGSGDSRVGLLIGFGLGWPLVLPAIFIAYLLGAGTGIGLLAAGKKEWGGKLPLGTFLAIAAVFTLFFGTPLVEWYLGLINF